VTLEVTRKADRVDRAAAANPLQALKDALPGLSGARRDVATLILAEPGFVGSASITAVAERAGALPATLTRLASSLGYPGFPAMRAAIAEENGRATQADWETDMGTELRPEDAPDQVLSVLTGRQFGAMRSAMASIDLPLVEELAERIVAAARVAIFAQWGDMPPARELQMRLMRVGIPVWMHEVAYEAEVSAGTLAPGDVALALSRSGESELVDRFLRTAADRGAHTAVITGEPRSSLGRMAQMTVYTGTGLGNSWTDYFAGRISDSLTTGLLFVLVAQRVPEAARAGAENLLYSHPGGPGSQR
jgi:DNA-binding MurR/RpiR family transcriptional regulator